MSQSVLFLTAYLDETHDTDDVMALLRAKYPSSIAVYISQIKSQWLKLNKPCDEYESAMAALVKKVITSDKKKFAKKLNQFHQSTVEEKYNIQKSLKYKQYIDAEIDLELVNIPIIPDFIADLKISTEERQTLAKKSEAALMTKTSNVFNIDVGEILSKAHTILENAASSNMFDVAVALSIVSGRRMIEIMKIGTFTNNDNNKGGIVFTGQAKKKDVVEYTIPLLINYDTFSTALTRLRYIKDCSTLDNNEVNLRYSNSCNVAARRVLGPKRHFHDARAIYAITAFNILNHKLSMNNFIMKVLGHANFTSSFNYSCVKVTNYSEYIGRYDCEIN
jgi:integrase